MVQIEKLVLWNLFTSQQRKPIKCMFSASKQKQSTNPFTKDKVKKLEEKKKLGVY